MYIVVFNPGNSPVSADEEGHSVGPHDWAVADEEYVRGALHEGTLLRTDVSKVSRVNTNPAVIMAKEKADAMNAALQPEESEDESAEEEKPAVKKTAKKK